MNGRVAVLVALVVFSGCVTVDLGDSTQRPDDVTVTVVEVVDGDTVDVRYQNGTRDTVRLIGVDTPEVHVENSPREFGYENTSDSRAWLRDWGHKGSEFARAKLLGEEVRLSFDSNIDRRGGYGRLLAYVHYNGTLFNKQLLTQGYARVYENDFTRRTTFDDAAATARADDVGLWGYDSQSVDGEANVAASDAPTDSFGGSSPAETFDRRAATTEATAPIGVAKPSTA